MITKAEIEAFFLAEKNTGLFILIVAAIAIIAGLYLLLGVKTPFAKGIAIALMGLAIIQAFPAWTVYNRSDEQRKQIVYALDMNPDQIAQQEIPRMQKVLMDFNAYQVIQVVLLVIGLVLFIMYRQAEASRLMAGIGLGIMIQALILLPTDFISKKRNAQYLKGLQEWTVQNRQG